MAAVRERLRVARDMHDLLGRGLSALALKADLIGKLIGRDDSRAAGEMGEMSRICAAARAYIRLVTGDGQQLSLAAELAAARRLLASAGIKVHACIPGGPLPAAADEVLAPVLREAVTNHPRHSAATSCTIETTAAGSLLRLAVSNDGVTGQAAAALGAHGPTAGGGSGLANLTARGAGRGWAAGQPPGRRPVRPDRGDPAARFPGRGPTRLPGRPTVHGSSCRGGSVISHALAWRA
jgi:signal transduction histidine kinase